MLFPWLPSLLEAVLSIMYTENRRAISSGVILAMCRLIEQSLARVRVSDGHVNTPVDPLR